MITLVTAFYILQSKFTPQKYQNWFKYLLPNIKNFNLVIFCDENSKKYIDEIIDHNNDNIKLVNLNIQDFYNYKYKQFWINNHKNNDLLNHNSKHNTCWELNMLWNEKISFVKKAYEEKYFNSDWYGWMDIGYFRNELNTTLTEQQIQNWPSQNKINNVDPSKIHYLLVNNDKRYITNLYKIILRKNKNLLPVNPIPSEQTSIAGGFFLIHSDKINWYHKLFDDKLYLYFKNNYLVKDDQIIVVDCAFTNIENFLLHNSNNDWFYFQKLLL